MMLKLSNGIEIPCIGMGTYPLKGEAMTKAVSSAIGFGYRAFDTAQAYGNEDSLGYSLSKAFHIHGIQRSDVFITSKIGEKLDNGIPDCKLFYDWQKEEKKDIKTIVSTQVDSILENLRTDYLDLLLIHWPFPDYLIEIWKAVEDEYRNGRVKSIGVSNFRERHLQKIMDSSEFSPMVNQIELHPLHTRKNLVNYCRNYNILVQAYSPLAVMNKKLFNSSLIKDIAGKYRKTPAQIILRWHIDQGIMPIPKSGNPVRLKENIQIDDFSLTPDEISSIDSINEDYSALVESIYCPGY